MKKYNYQEICVQMSKICTQIDKLENEDLSSIKDLKQQSIKLLKSKLKELDIVLESESELYFHDLSKENSNFFKKNFNVFRKTFNIEDIPFYSNPNFIMPNGSVLSISFDNIMVVDKQKLVFNKNIDTVFTIGDFSNYNKTIIFPIIDKFRNLKKCNINGITIPSFGDWKYFQIFSSSIKFFVEFIHFANFLKNEYQLYKEKIDNLYFLDKIENNKNLNKLNKLLKNVNIHEKNILKYVEYEKEFLDKCNKYNFYKNFLKTYIENLKNSIGNNIEINSIVEDIFNKIFLLLIVVDLFHNHNIIKEKNSMLYKNNFKKTFIRSKIEDEKMFKVARDFIAKFGFVFVTHHFYEN